MYIKCLSTFLCCGWTCGCILTLIPVQVGAKFWKIKVRWSQNDVVVSWFRCQPLLTTSHIHIGCINSDWAPSYAVDGHMGASLHCCACVGSGQILESWNMAEPKWHCGVIVEAVNHHWLHPTSILDVYRVFEHLHMLWICIWVHPYSDICAGVGQILEN